MNSLTNWPFLLTQLNFNTTSTKPKQLWDRRILGFSLQGGYLKALPWNNALNEVCNCSSSPAENKIWCHCNETDNTLLPQKKACDKIKGFPCSIREICLNKERSSLLILKYTNLVKFALQIWLQNIIVDDILLLRIFSYLLVLHSIWEIKVKLNCSEVGHNQKYSIMYQIIYIYSNT